MLRGHIASLLDDAAALPGRRAGLLKATAYLGLQVDFGALGELAGPREQHAGPRMHTAPDDLPTSRIPCLAATRRHRPRDDVAAGDHRAPPPGTAVPRRLARPVLRHAHAGAGRSPPLRASALGTGRGHQPPGRGGVDRGPVPQARAGLYRSGKKLAALRELHEAKVKWWHGDTTRDSILAMLRISGIYSDLLLLQAAKKYALRRASPRSRQTTPGSGTSPRRALFQAADCDYQSGAWALRPEA